jgi:DNA-binding CsgD family transcriptional regulator
MREIPIGEVDAIFMAQFDTIAGISDADVDRARAVMDKGLDEDGYITQLVGGLRTLDFPGVFGMTPHMFVSYPKLARSPEAREAASKAVRAWAEHWQDLHQRWPELACILEIAYAPGDPHWEPIRIRAYETLAERLPFSSSQDYNKPGVWKAIARRAREQQQSRAVVKHMSLVTGLVLAWNTQTEPHRVRIGKHWVKDAKTGRITPMTPNLKVMRWPYFWKWLCQEAARLATADLLGNPMRPTHLNPNAGDISPWLDALVSTPADASDAAGDASASADLSAHLDVQFRQRFDAIQATPREREIALFRALHPDATSAEVAEALHISPATVRVLHARLKQRQEAS